MLVIRNIRSAAMTTRWRPIPVAFNWRIGGRWREESFLNQGMDYEPPWPVISSLSPVVGMVTTSSPPSCPGTQWLSPGKRPETLVWRETTMQPLRFQLQLLPSYANIELKTTNYLKRLVIKKMRFDK